jgi:hypothetical protein
MANNRCNWNLAGSELSFAIGKEVMATFDLELLFPEFNEYDEAQQRTISYGVQQNLADKTARTKDTKLTVQERVDVMKKRYDILVVERIWRVKSDTTRVSGKKILTEAERLLKAGKLSQEAFDILSNA